MTNTAVAYHSSQSVEWSTPQLLFDALHAEFGFTLDAAAQPHNAKCPRFFTPEDDGLAQPWAGEVVWCNPPYGQFNVARWIQKGFEESRNGATVVMLVPSRTDARWFHDFAKRGEIRFIRGRLKFGGAKDNAPFASLLVVFRPEPQ